ncbi:MAG: L-2-amino-thiazoline-4-carboxylic acid hydrolase [Promethearchaeota archaeon]
MSEMHSKEDCRHQVRRMGNLFGRLYYHFANTLVNELGHQKGKELILKAVHSYGTENGKEIREKVLAQGLDLTMENFFKFQSLPALGWESNEEGVTYCSYAEPWIARAEQEIGKLYCEVDFAKIKAYNPKIRVKRVTTILDGDPHCSYIFEEE